VPLSKAEFQKNNQDVINWLLEPDNPSVRYFTLRQLLEHPDDSREVAKTRAAIQKSTSVKTILSHQRKDGGWPSEQKLNYEQWGKKATVYTMTLLSELGASQTTGTQRALDFLHKDYQLASGLINYTRIKSKRRYNSVNTTFWCLTALTLRSALLLGHEDHPLTKRALTFFETNFKSHGGWKCSYYTADPTKVRPPHCYMGTIKLLNALRLISPVKRTTTTRRIIKTQVNTCLENQIYQYRLSKTGQPTSKRSWQQFAFPRFWKSDALEAADVLTQLGIHDPRMTAVIELINKKRQPTGRWHLDQSLTKDAWVELEPKDTLSKWITLRALRVLKHTTPTT
jgi:hypothetical protein